MSYFQCDLLISTMVTYNHTEVGNCIATLVLCPGPVTTYLGFFSEPSTTQVWVPLGEFRIKVAGIINEEISVSFLTDPV